MHKKSLLLLTAALFTFSVFVAPPATSATRTMSNGCTLSARGIPSCGAMVGAAIGLNDAPGAMETQFNHILGVHRTFWGSGQISSAASQASADLKAGRMPWISFTTPKSWSSMATGGGDSWARSIATRFSQVNGPVWIAIHHEPEGDGDLSAWKKMQVRLGPILRNNAPNIGFSVILTGWDNLYGPTQYRLSNLWPNTKVDVAGFDIYNHYGTTKNGTMNLKNVDFASRYFQPIQNFLKPKGVRWGLAETGYSNKMAVDHPDWLGTMYSQLKSYGGVAMSYFNSNAHSFTDWRLNTTARKNQYAKVIAGSPNV